MQKLIMMNALINAMYVTMYVKEKTILQGIKIFTPINYLSGVRSQESGVRSMVLAFIKK